MRDAKPADERDWNAETYHRVSEPQLAWGEQVLAELELEGGETVMDAGCGTGRLTERLAERLPRGRVVALDASPAMLGVAARELGRFGDRVTFVRAELGRDALPSGMDVVFSTATFHWVRDHDALFRTIAAALVPGGRLHAQCGGAGNLARTHAEVVALLCTEPWAEHFAGDAEPWQFASTDDTRARLVAAGFDHADAWLHDAPTSFADATAFAEFVGTVVLRPFLARLPSELHARFVSEVTARAERASPALTLDYVRLELRARRA